MADLKLIYVNSQAEKETEDRERKRDEKYAHTSKIKIVFKDLLFS